MAVLCARPWPLHGRETQELICLSHSEDYALKIRQQPRDALLAQDGKEKSEYSQVGV